VDFFRSNALIDGHDTGFCNIYIMHKFTLFPVLEPISYLSSSHPFCTLAKMLRKSILLQFLYFIFYWLLDLRTSEGQLLGMLHTAGVMG